MKSEGHIDRPVKRYGTARSPAVLIPDFLGPPESWGGPDLGAPDVEGATGNPIPGLSCAARKPRKRSPIGSHLEVGCDVGRFEEAGAKHRPFT